MFLYELAIELDLRSAELVDAAASLGYDGLTSASSLDAAQVAALRRRFAPQLPPPPPPPMGAPGGGAGAFAAPGLALPPAPPTVAPSLAGAPLGGFAPPPPPPPASGAPHVSPSGAGDGVTSGQKVAIGVVVAIVVGLFGFMVVNSGPDEARERELAAAERAAEPSRPLELTGPPPPANPSAAEPTTSFAQDLTAPVDIPTFCEGAAIVGPFEVRLWAASYDRDLAEMQELVRDRQAEWSGGLDLVSVGGPPSLVDEVERYEAGYLVWFDAIARTGSYDEMLAAIDTLEVERAMNAGQEFARQFGFYCD